MSHTRQALKEEKIRLLRAAYRSLGAENQRFICNELDFATHNTQTSCRAYNELTSYIDKCLGDYGSYDVWAEDQPWFPSYENYPAGWLFGDMVWPKHYYKKAHAARRRWIKHMITLVESDEL